MLQWAVTGVPGKTGAPLAGIVRDRDDEIKMNVR